MRKHRDIQKLLNPRSYKSIWTKVTVKRKRECWPFKGHLTHDGYAGVRIGNKSVRVARVMYTIIRGPIPEGLVVDHLCRKRWCVNPYHLEAVTDAVNIQRMFRNSERTPITKCKRGHPYKGENVGITTNARGKYRFCRKCKQDLMKSYWDRTRKHASHR